MFLLVIVGLIIAITCAVLWFYTRGHIVAVTGAGWLGYVLYEVWVQNTCTGECNIRVDLLLLYPLLLGLTLASLFFVIRRRLRRRGGKA